MNRAFLSECLEQGLSLIEIGGLTGRDPSTVGYWVGKHSLTPNGREKYAPRGGLAREDLEALVEQGMTLQQIASVVGRSTSTVRYWLQKFGLKTKRRHRRAAAIEARDAGRRRFTSACRYHGETDFLVFDSGRSRCATCNSEAVARRRRAVKQALIAEAGGGCALCGYDRYQGALQFHHLDRSTKEFGLSRKGVTISIERSRAEARKCVLLCANCHAEVEGGVASLS